jgi:cell wall assembly regulator SMI1
VIDDLLTRLENWIKANRPEYYLQLNPGATDDEIEQVEILTGLELPTDFKAFLKWHNGQSGEARFFDNYILLSCDGIIGFWQSLTKWQLDGDFEVEGW